MRVLNRIFEEQVARTPHRIAVVCHNEKTLTYLEINQRANQVARNLLSHGLLKGQTVALKMERSSSLIIAMLGIWKARGVYLPIDINLPAERINYLTADTNPKFVFTDIDWDNLDKYDTSNLVVNAAGEDPAYQMYTSGSTGLPTGVLIEHKAASIGFRLYQKQFNYSENDVFLLKATISFVTSLYEILLPLFCGGKVVILGKEGDRDIKKIVDAIEKNKVTSIEFVPAVLSIFLDYIENNKVLSRIASLKAVFASGEALSLKLVQDFNETLFKINGTVLYNTYGLTETAVDVAVHNCSEENNLSFVPIGKPIDTVRIYILNDELQQLPIGETGSLWVAGDILAQGYVNNLELNERKYKALPALGETRVFNTGDIARWFEDGRLQYLGRRDRQVKIRGNRVEIDEIEYYLKNYDGIQNAVVKAILESENTEKPSNSLAAYYVTTKPIEISELRNYLITVLPEYMVPSYFVKMLELPLTPNGKIQMDALPNPNKAYSDGLKPTKMTPTNEIEEKLVLIWEELLEIKNIGIDEDFYELGGHSLLVIIMNLRIQKEFKVQISTFDVFKALTIKDQAELISNEKKQAGMRKERHIVLLNSKKQTNLFCFPPVGGYGLYFLPFAREVSSYSVYGFNFIEHENRLQEYTSEIIKRQPKGPYFLMGYSAGGNLVFEVAKDMERLGFTIGALILVSSEKKWHVTNRSGAECDQEVDRIFNNVIMKDFQRFIPNEDVKKSIQEKTRHNLLYMDQLVNEGMISADIYVIQVAAEETWNDTQDICSWINSTKGKLYEHKGFGDHFYMMQEPNVIHNAKIIENILTRSGGK